MTLALHNYSPPLKSYPFTFDVLGQGFPTPRLEDFKYFPLVSLPETLNTQVNPVLTENILKDFLKSLPIDPNEPLLIIVDGLLSALSSEEIKPYVKVNEDFTQNVLEVLPSFHWDYFKSIALNQNSPVIDISLTEELGDKTLQILCLTSQPDFLCSPRISIHIKKNVKSSVSFLLSGMPSAQKSLMMPYIFTFLEKDSICEFSQFITVDTDTFSLPYLDIYQKAGSSFFSWSSCLSGNKVRMAVGCMLDGEKATTDLKGCYLAAEKDQMEFFTKIYHKKPYTTSNQFFKGLATKGGHFSFNGDIVVDPHAKGVKAYQLSKNIVADKSSRVFTRPQLHIWHHDLQCTHGATVGGLNNEELFYLQSRGISLPMAKYLSMLGFLDEITQSMVHSHIKEYIQKKLSLQLEVNYAHS